MPCGSGIGNAGVSGKESSVPLANTPNKYTKTAEIWVRTIYQLKPAKGKSITTRPGIEVFRE